MYKVLVAVEDTKTFSASQILEMLNDSIVSSSDWYCESISRCAASMILETENPLRSITYMAKDIAELGDAHNIVFNFQQQDVDPESPYTAVITVHDFLTRLGNSEHTKFLEPHITYANSIPVETTLARV